MTSQQCEQTVGEEKKQDAGVTGVAANSKSITPSKAFEEFVPDPSLMQTVSPQLCFREEWIVDIDEDDDAGPVIFHVALPSSTPQQSLTRLTFRCHDRSTGVLLPSENEEISPLSSQNAREGGFDPLFFEKGFSLEAKTGFQVWPGSRLMVEAFALSTLGELTTKGEPLNILEVGAGIGLVGTCLAVAGHHVLVTDLPLLVDHGIAANLRNNRLDSGDEEAAPPSFVAHWHPEGELPSTQVDSDDEDWDCDPYHRAGTPVPVGKGWATAVPLDWRSPLREQLSSETLASTDIMVGCDCMFLRALIDPILSVVGQFFASSRSSSPAFYFTYERRNMMGLFIGLEELLHKIRSETGWIVDLVAWRTIHVEGDGDHDLHIFRLSP
mmetsp:Transcript_7746/g.19262  ORF Transcript_7746/g.19262 Transcript_7746/m.19262 type:complete len:382 (+) Transcript_7746:206-1351(+)